MWGLAEIPHIFLYITLKWKFSLMNTSESNLLSGKIINGNPSLQEVWKDVHRVQHWKIFPRLLHIFTSLTTANKEYLTGQKEIRSVELSPTHTWHWAAIKQIGVGKQRLLWAQQSTQKMASFNINWNSIPTSENTRILEECLISVS